MPDIVLYNYWRSSSSHRVRIALALKGLAYTYAAVDLLRDEQSAPDFVARSPAGYVPCLTIDGVSYTESVAIVELLDERFASPPLYPRDAHRRARVRALVEIVNSGVQPLHNRHVVARVSSDATAQKGWARHFIERGLRAFERAMEGHAREGVEGRYAFGDELGAADVFLVPQVHAAARFGADLSACPRVVAAAAAAELVDAVRLAAPERQPDAP